MGQCECVHGCVCVCGCVRVLGFKGREEAGRTWVLSLHLGSEACHAFLSASISLSLPAPLPPPVSASLRPWLVGTVWFVGTLPVLKTQGGMQRRS